MALPKAAKSIVLMDGNGMIGKKRKIRQLPMMHVVDKLRGLIWKFREEIGKLGLMVAPRASFK